MKLLYIEPGEPLINESTEVSFVGPFIIMTILLVAVLLIVTIILLMRGIGGKKEVIVQTATANSTSDTRFCHKCGAALEKPSSFCPHCGAEIKGR